MKKIILAVLLMPGLSWGAVTEAQVDQGTACLICISLATDAALQYAANVKALFRSSWTVAVNGSTTTIAIPQSMQDQFVNGAKWQAKLAPIEACYNGCP